MFQKLAIIIREYLHRMLLRSLVPGIDLIDAGEERKRGGGVGVLGETRRSEFQIPCCGKWGTVCRVISTTGEGTPFTHTRAMYGVRKT